MKRFLIITICLILPLSMISAAVETLETKDLTAELKWDDIEYINVGFSSASPTSMVSSPTPLSNIVLQTNENDKTGVSNPNQTIRAYWQIFSFYSYSLSLQINDPMVGDASKDRLDWYIYHSGNNPSYSGEISDYPKSILILDKSEWRTESDKIGCFGSYQFAIKTGDYRGKAADTYRGEIIIEVKSQS